ncbi:MAG: DUF2867 domain-containing protein [Chloroflexia bacterium]
MRYIEEVPALRRLAQGADHLDVKTVDGKVSLREFIAGMLDYEPGWLKFLYLVRGRFVRLLGMRQSGVPVALRLRPAEVPMTPGAPAGFFTVLAALEGEYWLGSAADKHLDATLGIVVERLGGTQHRFYVVTIVHYKNWAGPVYFNVIRPFHHLVVGAMARAAARRTWA